MIIIITTKLFIKFNYFLKTEFEINFRKNRNILTKNFKLKEINELFEIREFIWNKLFLLFENSLYKNDILKLISLYPEDVAYKFYISKVEVFDSKLLLDFFEKSFDKENYQECRVVQNYIEFLEKRDIPFDK